MIIIMNYNGIMANVVDIQNTKLAWRRVTCRDDGSRGRTGVARARGEGSGIVG